MKWRLAIVTLVAGFCVQVAQPVPAFAVSTCGGVKDTCKCGANNPYPCCANGSNCTWWSWHAACCNWKIALPGWSHAKTWRNYALSNPGLKVLNSPVAQSIAVRTHGTYGHVAWVKSVSGGTIHVSEMNCCGKCHYGMRTKSYAASYFNGGFIVHNGHPALGPKCGDKKCEKGETCKSCSKDCGSCCGNGKCDYGETCGSCNKDCKCMPKGQLATATCTQVTGWAQDPDNTKAKLKVRLYADGKQVAEVGASANGPKNGHSFKWMTDASLKDGKPHTIEGRAKDSQTGKLASIGKSALVCSNAMSHEGIWTTTRLSSAAIGVKLASPQPPQAGVAHVHSKASKYPLAGTITTCTRPGMQAVQRVTGGVSWQLNSKKLRSTVLADGVAQASWKSGGPSEASLEIDRPLTELCLQTTVTAEAPLKTDQHVGLKGLLFHRDGWRYSYSPDAAGMTVGIDPRFITLAPRSKSTEIKGFVRVWRAFAVPFDGVTARLGRHGIQPELALVSDPTAKADHPGQQVVEGTGATTVKVSPRKSLVWQVRPTDSKPWLDGQGVTIEQVRVHRSNVEKSGPWRVRHKKSWNLRTTVDASEQRYTPGRSLTLRHDGGTWWSIGQLHAALDIAGRPFSRVRGKVALQGETSQLAVSLAVADGALDRPTPVLESLTRGPFEVVAHGKILHANLRLPEELPPGSAEASVRLSELAFLQDGWWTAAGPTTTGLDCAVDGLDAVTLKTPAPEGKDSEQQHGIVSATRDLPSRYAAVSFSVVHDLDPSELRPELLLDGEVADVNWPPAGQPTTIEVTDSGFSSVTFRLRDVDGPVPPSRRIFAVSKVAVANYDGQWTGLGEIPYVPVAGGGVVTSGVTTAKSPAAESGCQTSRKGRKSGLFWAMALALASLLAARRGRENLPGRSAPSRVD